MYIDGPIELRCGDWRDALSTNLIGSVDLIIADPPYGQTSLEWDCWPLGWPTEIIDVTKPAASMWCYGSIRMFMQRASEFAGWKMAQDLVWRKQNGSGFHRDRFRRVHEQIVHFYRGKWGELKNTPPVTMDAVSRKVGRSNGPPHMGKISVATYESHDGGPRLQRSVLDVKNCHGYAIHPTQKPVELSTMLIQCSCPRDGTVFIPFAGSGTDLVAARSLGIRAVGYESDGKHFADAVQRLKSERPIGVMQ